jgi:hypothetical protein
MNDLLDQLPQMEREADAYERKAQALRQIIAGIRALNGHAATVARPRYLKQNGTVFVAQPLDEDGPRGRLASHEGRPRADLEGSRREARNAPSRLGAKPEGGRRDAQAPPPRRRRRITPLRLLQARPTARPGGDGLLRVRGAAPA